MLVSFHNTVEPIALRREDITVKREAVVRPIVDGRDRSTKAKQRNLFVMIVILQNITDALDRLKVLISVQVFCVQGVWVVGVPI